MLLLVAGCCCPPLAQQHCCDVHGEMLLLSLNIKIQKKMQRAAAKRQGLSSLVSVV
jgi:hypothetical protein